MTLSSTETNNLYILCAGEGNELKVLKKFVDEHGLSDHIRFLGSRQDIAQLLKCANFMVLPSLSEGMPMSILESLAMECPVLATDSDGIREVLTPECGIIVPPANVEALADGLKKMLKADRVKMGKAGRIRVENNFSLEQQIDSYEALYYSLLKYYYYRVR